MATQIAIRQGSREQWVEENPVLHLGEIAGAYRNREYADESTKTNWILKVGDGATPWNDLQRIETGHPEFADIDCGDLDNLSSDSI